MNHTLSDIDPGEAEANRFAGMPPSEIRAFEVAVVETIADLALIPPMLNTSPLPDYDYDRLDYGMAIAIARAPGGRLWACWVAGEDGPQAFMLLATSDDNGDTWSKPRLVIDTHDPARLPLPRSTLVGALWTDPDGHLRLFFSQSIMQFDGRAGVWETVCAAPDAECPDWSAPRRIWHGHTLNKPIVLSTGEWLLPVSLNGGGGLGCFRGAFRALDTVRGANVFASSDRGATWRRRGCVAFANPSWDEHMLVERADGSIWMLARTHDGLRETFSCDAGRTWSPPSRPEGIRHPESRFHLRRLASGRLLLVKHGDTVDSMTRQGTGKEGDRNRLKAFLSEDDGRTWMGGLMLDERTGVSYPDGCEAPDGTLYVLYDRNRSTDGEILMARFSEQDILAGRLVSPGSRLRMLVCRPLKSRHPALA